MDMNSHLRKWLNDAALREMDDRYEGVILAVTEELIRNRFTAQKVLEPVIAFKDGYRLVPNINQRRALVEFFGPESDEWVGRRLVVYRHRSERRDGATGALRVTYEKRVALPKVEAYQPSE